MNALAITGTVQGQIEDICSRLTEAIKPAGFGILTRIDFDKKIKEKIGEAINPCIILGACNPKLAHEAYLQSSDAALLIPCNIVLTEIALNTVKIEAVRPSEMLRFLPVLKSTASIEMAEQNLYLALKDAGFVA